MRVVFCCDRVGSLPSAEVGAALARAFVAARAGVQAAVVPMGASGADLADALHALGDTSVVVTAPAPDAPASPGIDTAASSVGLGRKLATALAARPTRVVLDLTRLVTHDGGAGLLAALGATADVPLDAGVGALADLSTLDMAPARAALGATELVAVVPDDQLGDLLLGLRGVTARRAHLSGVRDPALMLATDAALGRLAGLLGVPDAPGVGAVGGAALAVMALGGWLSTGPALVTEAAGLARTASAADLVVTASDTVDALRRGGPVVTEVVAVAERAQRPCIAVARDVSVSGRELRQWGLEAAHPVPIGPDATPAALTEAARGIAVSWTW